MQLYITALILGLMGSVHCAGMCGPIALALPLHGNSVVQKVAGSLLYNLGRIITYGIMGAIFGLLGRGLELMGFQRIVSIAMGTLMILSILFPAIFRVSGKGLNFRNGTSRLRQALGRLFSVRSFQSLFLIGLLNGLLPCGLVYIAIAGSIGVGTAAGGTIFMILFGLGTLPMLLAINLSGGFLSAALRQKLNKLIPTLVVLVGILFILRGLSLGIPYISPSSEKIRNKFQNSLSQPDNQVESRKDDCCSHSK